MATEQTEALYETRQKVEIQERGLCIIYREGRESWELGGGVVVVKRCRKCAGSEERDNAARSKRVEMQTTEQVGIRVQAVGSQVGRSVRAIRSTDMVTSRVTRTAGREKARPTSPQALVAGVQPFP